MKRTALTLSRRLADLEGRNPGRIALPIIRTIREQGDPMPEDEPGVLHIVRTIIDPEAPCAR